MSHVAEAVDTERGPCCSAGTTAMKPDAHRERDPRCEQNASTSNVDTVSALAHQCSRNGDEHEQPGHHASAKRSVSMPIGKRASEPSSTGTAIRNAVA